MQPQSVRIIAFVSFLLPFLIALIQSYFNELSSLAHPNYMRSPHLHDWTIVGTLNNIKTYMKANEGSPLITYRAITVLDYRLDIVVNALLNSSDTTSWAPSVDKMSKLVRRTTDAKRSSQSAVELFHIVSSLPTPIASRDFLIQRSVQFSALHKNVVVNHTSIVDEDLLPKSEDVVRGQLVYSNWILQDYEEYCREFRADSNASDAHLDVYTAGREEVIEDSLELPAAPIKVVVSGKCSMKLTCKLNSLYRIVAEWLHGSTSEDDNDDDAEVDDSYSETESRFKTSADFSAVCSGMTSSSATGRGGESGAGSHIARYRTLLVMDTLVDAGGSLPPWFVSYFHSMTWPLRTIVALRQHLSELRDSSE